MFKFSTKRKIARDRITVYSLILFATAYSVSFFDLRIGLPTYRMTSIVVYGAIGIIVFVYRLYIKNNKLTIEGTILTISNGFKMKEIDLDNYYEFTIERMNRGHAYIYAISKENYSKEKVTIASDVYNKTINDILKAINKAVSNELSEDNVWDF